MTHVTDERLGRFACQQADLFRRIREGGVDVEYASSGIQRIMEHKLLVRESQAFTVSVNYDQTVEEALSAGDYDWASNDLTSQNFQPTRRGIETVEVYLVHFGCPMTSEKVFKELDKQGFCPAPIEELLALTAAYPDLQRQALIVGIGSVWQDPSGDRRVPALWNHQRGRSAHLYWFDLRWNSDVRFAAVRK